MIQKYQEKEKAINLRKRGFSYNEILREVPVAKSTLSLWLRDVGLSKRQKQKLTERKIAAQKRGALARKKHRIELTQKIKHEAQKDVGKISGRELWLIGTMLYWAEGSKEKDNSDGYTAAMVELINMDPAILNIFQRWLFNYCGIKKEDLVYSIRIHSRSPNVDKAEEYWRQVLNIDKKQDMRIYYKKHNPKTVRKNINRNYYGACAIRVRRSTNLNRKIAGWFEGVCNNMDI